ncbi:hypothetical protein CIB48_g10663 [Xylaria polymorpha]|nr:hypothetical protein CIB48_g10663 [Xylaria polymorpha]
MIDYAAREDGVNPYSGEPLGVQRLNRGRSSNAPIVVASPVSASMPQTSRTSVTSLSEDSGLSSSFDAQPTVFADGYVVPTDGHSQVSMANGSLKQRIVNSGTFGSQNGQSRPGGQRNNSVPHVPGEYPRSTPGGTPLA